ncbi:hypothetical protein GCM10027299_00060 [Larkinella ripae]
MKHTFIGCALWASVLFLNACQTKQHASEATSPVDSTEILTDRNASEPEPSTSDWLEKLAGPEEGLFRGINLGDGVAVVKQKESADPFEQDATHLGYTIEYENLESVDIQYFLDNNKKVSGIQVDIYLNNRKSVDEHSRELTAYFNRRFGNATQQQSWKIAGNDRVTLKDVSKGKDFGLKLTFGRNVNV